MLVLVVDTSTATVSAGLVEVAAEGAPLTRAEASVVDARRHSETLAPLIQRCLEEAGATVKELTAVVAGVGPGPFTGLRVGLATAAAMGDALGVPTYGVCSLDAIAADTEIDGPVLVATDARRREIYWATYDRTAKDRAAHGARTRLTGPAVNRPAEVAERFTDDDPARPVAAVGAGAELYADILGLPVTGPLAPSAAALADLAADRIVDGAESEILTPLYLRRPDVAEPGDRKRVLR